MSAPLVIITRPHEAGAPLAAALRTTGFAPFEWPLLALEPEPEALDRLPATLPGADWLVVVSPSAARLIAPALARLPTGLRLAAVGRATAQVLEQASYRPVLHPATGNDSEALLALPDWGALDGRTVVIAKGHGNVPGWLKTCPARRPGSTAGTLPPPETDAGPERLAGGTGRPSAGRRAGHQH